MTQPTPKPLTPAQLETARALIVKAKTHLVLDYPFFAAMLLQKPLKEFDATFAVDKRGQIYWSPRFVIEKKLTLQQVIFALCHEVMHVVGMDFIRMGARQPRPWNHACVTADTPVLMGDGSVKPALLVRPGDYVATPFGSSPVEIVSLKAPAQDYMLEVCFSNGYKLHCTHDHKILTERGYVYAEELRAGDDACCVDTRHGRLLETSERYDVCQGHGETPRVVAEAGVFQAGTARYIEEPSHAKTHELARVGEDDRAGDGVLGGADRRGGYDRMPSHETIERSNVPAPDGNRFKHLAQPDGVVGFVRDVFQSAQERGWSVVLESRDQRVSMSGPSEAGSPLRESTSTSVRHPDRDMRAAPSAGVAGRTDAVHHELVRGIEGFEYARVAAINRLPAARCVVDITTPERCFIAAGVVVHNCDGFINDTLKSCNIGEPIEGCVDMPGSKDKTKEEIYANFPPPDPNGGGGQGQGDGEPDYGDGAGDYGIGDDFFDDGSGPLSEAEIGQIEAETKVAVSQAAQAARMQGKLPAAIDRLVEEILTVKTPWYEKLSRFMHSAAKSEYSWRKPNKRFAHMGMYLPSQDSQCAMGTMVFAVDTSGSIGDKELQYAAGHLNAIMEQCKPEKLVVIYCDAAVNKVVEFTHDELPCRLEAVGGGGTDFRGVFTHVEEQLTETPACLVYFTDMMGTFPADPPPYPVLWLNIDKPAQPPFGEEVMFDMDEEN